MTKKDNIIDFRDYQPGKRETIETNSLDAFRASLFNLGFTAPSSSNTLDESKEVEPETEVEETEAVEEPTVEVEETTDPATEEGTSETDDESEGESMVEETEPDDEPEVVESEEDDNSESDDEEEPEIVDEDDSDDDDFLYEYDEEDDDEEIKEEPDKFKAPEGSLSDLIIKETERGFRRFDSDEPLVEDDDSDEEIEEAEFEEVDSESEEKSSESEEEAPVSRRKRHKHAAPSGAGTRFLKKLGNSFANSLLSNFGLGETPAVQPSKATEEESKAEDSTDKAEKFNSKAQELLSKEIMDGKVDKLNEWSKNDNVNKLMFLFSGNPVLSDWIMENEPDIFWDLPDEIIDVILEKNKKSSEKKDDKDEKKS
jgi:hypothetical protein